MYCIFMCIIVIHQRQLQAPHGNVRDKLYTYNATHEASGQCKARMQMSLENTLIFLT